jgi:hypothetical protein
MKNISLFELKRIIRKLILNETIYHSNVISLQDPIQPLVKAIKKEQNKTETEDRTKKYLVNFINEKLNLPADENINETNKYKPGNKLLVELLKIVPGKILKFVGGGKYGKVYKLEGNYVLKLYASEFGQSGADNEWYRKQSSDIYSGNATIDTLPVADAGYVTTKYLDNNREVEIKIYYAIMAELDTLINFIKRTRPYKEVTSDVEKFLDYDLHKKTIIDQQLRNFLFAVKYNKNISLEDFYEVAKVFKDDTTTISSTRYVEINSNIGVFDPFDSYSIHPHKADATIIIDRNHYITIKNGTGQQDFDFLLNITSGGNFDSIKDFPSYVKITNQDYKFVWHRNSNEFRGDDKPAKIEKTGNIYRFFWYEKSGVIFRSNEKPSIISYDNTSKNIELIWTNSGGSEISNWSGNLKSDTTILPNLKKHSNLSESLNERLNLPTKFYYAIKLGNKILHNKEINLEDFGDIYVSSRQLNPTAVHKIWWKGIEGNTWIEINDKKIRSYINPYVKEKTKQYGEMISELLGLANSLYSIVKKEIEKINSKSTNLLSNKDKKPEPNYSKYLDKEIQHGGFTVAEIESLHKTYLNFAKTNPDTFDLHIDNIGVLPSSNPANPVFIILDK